MENAFAAVSKQLNDADVVQTEAKENRCIIHCKKRNEDLKHLQKYSTLQESAISLTAEKNIQERFRS